VKAIKIENNAASIIDELCIHCGTCVNTCPVGAKQIRDDSARGKNLLRLKEKVILSLAPSWRTEFEGLEAGKLIAAVKLLGFFGVSETALGAEEVSANMAIHLQDRDAPLAISSACPVVVDYIRKYQPHLTPFISPFLSPLLAHCTLLRKSYGADIGIVFAGPCIAKKQEADDHPGLLNVALTFQALRSWLEQADIDPERLEPGADTGFIPGPAAEGGLYPMDGGMIAGITREGKPSNARFMSFSGMKAVAGVVRELEEIVNHPVGGGPLFLELLACEGGCINGPLMTPHHSTAIKRLRLIREIPYPGDAIPRVPTLEVGELFDAAPVREARFSESQIKAVLAKIGKRSPKDEFNCGGCGYDNCRDFAAAVLEGKAESGMCLHYMRKLAHKKANKLIEKMPSAVVIVDEDLRIIECNANFAALGGGEVELIYENHPGLVGANLEAVVPISGHFRKVLESGEDLLEKSIGCNDAILHCSIFSIERNHVVGGIIQDITQPSVRKEEIIRKARRVISENLKTVQKIAYLLGENASETEITLSSIIESFLPDAISEGTGARLPRSRKR
jgi:Na+-translocating ferredoxin:NAD+ oxidoreductase RNF subunit RnfB